MTIPVAWLEEYLETTGLGSRLALLAERFPMTNLSTETELEMSLEAYWLFQNALLPPSLEERILAGVDALKGKLVVRAHGPSRGVSGIELRSASSRAALLYAIRMAWSRAYAPCSGRVPAWPGIDVVERGSLPAEELELADLWTERLPDGRVLSMAPRSIAARLEAAAVGGQVAELAELGALSRYALGYSYNNALAPAAPFEFLDLLDQNRENGRALRDRYLELCLPGGRAAGQAYLDLAERSLDLEAAAIRSRPLLPDALADRSRLSPGSSSTGPASLSSRRSGISAQQLIGSPSSSGLAEGVLRRAPGLAEAPESVLSGSTVIACERFSRGLLALAPAAVIESRGGRLGAGAAIARAEGLPCVSGVHDVDLLPEGAAVRVDGWLGLVSVNGAKCGDSSP